MLRPSLVDQGPSISLMPGLPAQASWFALKADDVVTIADKPNRHLRRSDVVVQPAGSVDLGVWPDGFPDRASTVVVGPDGRWQVDGAERTVLVDPTVHRPVGRRSVATGTIAIARMESNAGILVIEAPQVRLRMTGDLAAEDVRSLREVSGLVVPADLPARWRAQLQACGVVLAERSDGFPHDDLGWQLASVEARRAALREWGPQAALGTWPTVSAVLVTHREQFLDHAIDQLSRLEYPNLQVVLGLHGLDLPSDRFAALAGRHQVTVVPLPADLVFGAAMQAACDRADGELLTKVDDDDYYGSEHVWDLVLARGYSGAPLVGKALDWIAVQTADCTAFRPEYAAEQYATFVAGGTMLISQADLRAVGGWRPVPRSIDRALIRRVQKHGGLVYRTHGLGYLYVRRADGHTANAKNEHFLTKNVARWPGLLRHPAFGTGPAEPLDASEAGR